LLPQIINELIGVKVSTRAIFAAQKPQEPFAKPMLAWILPAFNSSLFHRFNN